MMNLSKTLAPTTTHHEDVTHVQETLDAIPRRYHQHVISTYIQRYKGDSRQAANLYCLSIQERAIGSLIPLDDEAIRRKADRLSMDNYKRVAPIEKTLDNFPLRLETAMQLCDLHSIEPPIMNFPFEEWELLIEEEKEALVDIAEPAINQMCCAKWWKRKLRTLQDRQTEMLAINIGLVSKYVSDEMLARKKARLAASLEVMEQMIAISDAGDKLEMIDVLKASMANPELRRIELMVRARGFEEYADEVGLVGEFYTITCPSKMHPNSSKYDGTSPKEAQAYLVNQWAKIRSKLWRNNLFINGFRVVEAHRDGCVHWHLLLFMQSEHVKPVRGVISEYALEMDGDEKGAAEHRFEAVAVDKKKGSATGYIAKYISKNINGFGMEEDDETGDSAEDGAERVNAWASTWGVRQFQQIGGASVTVWRELRKYRKEEELPEGILRDLWKAADAAEWGQYIKLQGGAFCPRRELVVRPYYESINEETGEVNRNRYGAIVSKLKGVSVNWEGIVTPFITKTKTWRIEFKEDAQLNKFEDLVSDDNPIRFKGGIHPLDLFSSEKSGVCSPWSTDSNYSQTNSDTVF